MLGLNSIEFEQILQYVKDNDFSGPSSEDPNESLL